MYFIPLLYHLHRIFKKYHLGYKRGLFPSLTLLSVSSPSPSFSGLPHYFILPPVLPFCSIFSDSPSQFHGCVVFLSFTTLQFFTPSYPSFHFTAFTLITPIFLSIHPSIFLSPIKIIFILSDGLAPIIYSFLPIHSSSSFCLSHASFLFPPSSCLLLSPIHPSFFSLPSASVSFSSFSPFLSHSLLLPILSPFHLSSSSLSLSLPPSFSLPPPFLPPSRLNWSATERAGEVRVSPCLADMPGKGSLLEAD